MLFVVVIAHEPIFLPVGCIMWTACVAYPFCSLYARGLIILQLCLIELLWCLLQICRAITFLMWSMYDISGFMLVFMWVLLGHMVLRHAPTIFLASTFGMMLISPQPPPSPKKKKSVSWSCGFLLGPDWWKWSCTCCLNFRDSLW